MAETTRLCLLVSDFNTANLAAVLRNDDAAPALAPVESPYGQTMQVLLQEGGAPWEPRPEVTLVWTLPERVSQAFSRQLAYEAADDEAMLAEVDAFAALLARAAARTSTLVVPTWALPAHRRGLGLLEMKNARAATLALARMNLRLAEALRDTPNAFVLDARRWHELARAAASDPKLWYMSKVPFDTEVFRLAAADLKAALRAVSGQARKLIVLDLDETLWGGILGDAGLEGIELGGHSPTGEAYADFQRVLKGMTRRGILLAIASKNEEDVAWRCIDEHPEMVLRREDFVAWRINWLDKAKNIADLTAELNLGLQSVVFIDDNPVERARVRETLPEVLVPEWPKNPMLYPRALESLDCFEVPSWTAEDAARTEMYRAEAQRKSLSAQVGSIDEWLESLDIKVVATPLVPAHRQRAAQLLNKTNQMNLRTRRMSEAEFVAWAADDGHWTWTFQVEDKFGSSGLTGIASLETNGDGVEISDFVLSCRVMGRHVEEAILHTLVEHARANGLKHVRAELLRTEKNKPCLRFWQESGFDNDQDRVFTWNTAQPYPLPSCITLIHQSD